MLLSTHIAVGLRWQRVVHCTSLPVRLWWQ